MPRPTLLTFFSLVAVGAGACLPDYTFGGGGAADARPDATDGGRVDGTVVDGGHGDGTIADGGHGDTRSPEAGHGDATPEEAGRVDGGAPDASSVDAHGNPDGARDSSRDTGEGDALEARDASSAPDATKGGGDASAAPSDASTTLPADAGALPFAVLTTGAPKEYALGYGQQTHVIYAPSQGKYWVFYVDSTSNWLVARVGTPGGAWAFATIMNPPTLQFTDGNNFSVAYVNLSGQDAVHVVANAFTPNGGGTMTVDARGTLSGTTVDFTPAQILPDTLDTGSSTACSGDAPAVAVSASGYIYEITSWVDHTSTSCDTNVYRSTLTDEMVAEGSPTFDHDGYYILNPGLAYSHAILPLSDAGTLLAAWPDWDTQGLSNYESFAWATSAGFRIDAGAPGTTGVSEDAGAELFYKPTLTYSSSDDWALCRLAANDVHLVRHVEVSAQASTVSAFEEVTYDGTTWTPTAAPPQSVTSASNSGVVLLSGTSSTSAMLLATLGSDHLLHVSRRTSSGWSAFSAGLPTSANSQTLVGTGCGSTRPLVFWTDGTGMGPYTIYGADLSGLL